MTFGLVRMIWLGIQTREEKLRLVNADCSRLIAAQHSSNSFYIVRACSPVGCVSDGKAGNREFSRKKQGILQYLSRL
jgi:hypothetical protein